VVVVFGFAKCRVPVKFARMFFSGVLASRAVNNG
jgi:hypothetical protein